MSLIRITCARDTLDIGCALGVTVVAAAARIEIGAESQTRARIPMSSVRQTKARRSVACFASRPRFFINRSPPLNSEGDNAQQRATRLSEWPASIDTLTRSLNGRCLLRFATAKDGPACSEIGSAARQPDVLAIDGNGLSKAIDNPKRIGARGIARGPDHWQLVGVLSDSEASGSIRIHSPTNGSDDER